MSCPPPGDLADPGTEPASLMSLALAGRSFTTSTTWEAQMHLGRTKSKTCPNNSKGPREKPPGRRASWPDCPVGDESGLVLVSQSLPGEGAALTGTQRRTSD